MAWREHVFGSARTTTSVMWATLNLGKMFEELTAWSEVLRAHNEPSYFHTYDDLERCRREAADGNELAIELRDLFTAQLIANKLRN